MDHPLTFSRRDLNDSCSGSLLEFFLGVFKFQCMVLEKKIVFHRLFLQIYCNKIWQSAYELVHPGKNVYLFLK
jgi:hypothetical protein